MASNPSHYQDATEDYAHQVPAQQTFEWNEDAFYPQTSNPPSGHQSYYHHPPGQLMMEPAHPVAPHQSASTPMAPFPVLHPMQYHSDAYGSQLPDSAYQYAPSTVNVSRAPVYGLPPSPHSQPSPAGLGRQSPSTSSPRLTLNQLDLPDDVRRAINAALDSREYARGENVPAEILMPTVQKVDKEQWECRICTKVHKRRDHTLTHVRTAHLDNKGFRCAVVGCDGAFGRKGDLERHIASTHQAIDPPEAVCPRCYAQLHRKDNLIRHLKSCRVTPRHHVPSASTSRTSRRSDYPMPYPSAPYPTHSPRTPRHDSAVPQHSSHTQQYDRDVPHQPPTLQAPTPTAYAPSPSDVYYDHSGLGFIDVWHQVAAPYDYPFYDMGNSSTIPPRWA